jgi:GT2 family glycosyltransferase
MKLSVLVCSTHNRYKTFLPKILDQLFGQLKYLTIDDQKDVEILTLIDNKTIMLGTKRNNLIDISKGEYVVFVDDDDRVAEDYLSSLLEATQSGADVITFWVMVSLNGEEYKPCFYSKDFTGNFNTSESYHRLPNHIMCIRRELAETVLFKPILYGEDSDFSERLKPYLKTEHAIGKPLYYYDYNIETTEAQEHQREKLKKKSPAMCDVIILSKAKTKAIKEMTQHAIDTLNASEKPGIFNIIVMEQTEHTYSGSQTIPCQGIEFNYNGFANSGVLKGHAPWICIANNDLIFTRGWFHQMMLLKADVMSPLNPGDKRQSDIRRPQTGHVNGRHFSGWCFVMKRTIWERIGGFDEDFAFWCADNATVEQLKKIGVASMLVPASQVKHLTSVTLKTLDNAKVDELTKVQVRKFNRKYKQNLFNLGV